MQWKPEGYLCHLLLVVRHKSFNIWLVKERDIMFQSTKCIAGKGCFCRTAPRSKYTSSQWGASNGCGEKPLSCYVTPPHPLSCDKNATLDQVSPGRPSIEEREFWVCWSVWPRWDSRPSRIFSPHTTWPLTSPLCCCSCLAKPVLNCAQIVGRYNRWPMQSHVAALG